MDKSKPSSSRNASKARTPTYAKYLVQKTAFFGTAKKILTITQDSILIDNLNNDPRQREEIPFQDIVAIKRSPIYDAEFNIVSRRNDAPPIFCVERSRCLSDIYTSWDKYLDHESPRSNNEFTRFEVSKVIIPDNHDIYVEVDLIIYRTHLELVHKTLRCPPKYEKQYIEIRNSDSIVGSVVTIPFYSIGTLYKTHKGIVIEMKDSQVQHRLNLYDLEKTNNVINQIQFNYKEYIGAQIEVSTEEFDEGLVPEYVSPKVYKLFFLNTKVYKILESGHFFPVEIALSDDYIVEIDINNGLVIQKLDLAAVKHVIRMVPSLAAVQVIFDDLSVVTYVSLNEERGLLASNIYTLSSWKKTENAHTTLQDEFIHAVMPNYNILVHGWLEDGVELDYEVELIKRFTSAGDDERLYQALHEFNVNVTLKNFNEGDPKPLQFLVNLFCKNAKIILSKEFIAFWEAYQVYLTNLYPFEFESKPLIEEERIKTLAEYEEKLKHLNDKFQARQTDKTSTMVLNTQSVPLFLYKTEELLKGIILLISSKGLFKEIANNKLDQHRYESFLIDTARLLDSPYSTLSHLAGGFFRTITRFPAFVDRKNEPINKKFVLTSRVKLLDTISETLAKRVLVKHEDTKGHESSFILSILACLRILKTFVYDRKETTNPEDFQTILEYISKPYYFAIFNFLSRYRSVACVYDTTIIVNSFFQNCTTRELYKSYQEKFLNNSTLILLHIELVLSSLAVLQRKISVVLLSHLFLENPNACGLICRIFPKNLFRKVDFMSNDISKWTLAQWEQFFSLASKNFDTATEQWNQECREELLMKLRKIDEDINSKFNYCPPNRLHELFDSTFNHSGEFLLNIRWNHEELEMHYEVLQHKILVWKYYLTNLLEDSENPKFGVPVVNPAKLWNELNLRFTGTHNKSEMKLILKVMVLLYREQHAQVKDLNTMQYWLRCLTSQDFLHCRYLILQLFYTALSVEDMSVIRFNVKKFTDIGGIKVLSDVLCSLYFEEDHNIITEDQMEELRANVPEDMDYNYTKLDIKKHAYTPSLEKSAMIMLIINIYKCILYRPIDKTLVLDEKLLYPIPTAKYQIIEVNTVKCMINILLLKDDDLALNVLDFFTEYLCDKFTFRSLTYDTPLYEFLLVNVTPKTTHARFNLVLRIYQRIADEIFPEENPIRTYSNFLFHSISSQIEADAFDMLPLFRYFPKNLIWRLITVGVDDITQIYWSNCFETPEIVWNAEMREKLADCILNQVEPYRNQLINFSVNNTITIKDKMPAYTDGPAEVVYQNILDEVKVGPMMLRVWIKRIFGNFELNTTAVPIFIEKLSDLLKEYAAIQIPQATHKQLEDLLIILKAHAKAIKVYSLSRYTCFKEVIGILNYFSSRLSQEDLTQFHPDTLEEMSHFVLVLCRILYRAIKLDKSDNANIFLESKGLEALLFITQSTLRKITLNNQSELPQDYYKDLSLSYHDLKVINLTVRMTRRIFNSHPLLFINLEPKKKLQIFLDLQIITKIPLILFEIIKVQRETMTDFKVENNTGIEIFEGSVIEDQDHDHCDPAHASIFDVIASDPTSSNADVFIFKIFMLVKNLIDIFSELSQKIEFAASFVQSGLNWRFLEFLTYYGEMNDDSEKIHKLNYQSVLFNVEKICNIFRNNVIFSNEAYIWKLTGGFTSSRGIGIITSKEKSPKIIQSLNKIDNPDKIILANFHEGVINVLGKQILQLLLVDYFEPIIAPEEKDVTNIANFLKVFSTSQTDPATLWNEETRHELKALLISQIFDVNKSHGKLYLNHIENFKYTLHQKHLIISEIFISLYNKTPEWKIANPPQFLLKTMKNISDLWQILHDLDLRADADADIPTNLQNINDATLAIYNVISFHGFEDVLLSEESLTQLGLLLNDKNLVKIRDKSLAKLKSTCLDIFFNLSKKLSGSLKILENASILKNIIKLMRSNTKESCILNQKIIKIIQNIANEDSLKKALINYGFFVFLLESSLKTEIYPEAYRREAFTYVKDVIKNLPVNHLLNKLIFSLFPYNIQEIIYRNAKPEEMLKTVDLGYDIPKTMWTKMMRHEVLLHLSEESDTIQEKWIKYEAKEIRITDNIVFWGEIHCKTLPVFPELQENICIDNIYLKNLNKDPVFDSEDNIAIFVDHVATKAAETFHDFLKITTIFESSGQNMSAENQKEFERLSYQLVTLLTSLLLSLDKLIFDIQEKEGRESMQEIRAHHAIPVEDEELEIRTQPRGSVLQDAVLISENALSLIIECLELFNHLKINVDILSTELQLIYLIIDNERGFTLLKSSEVIKVLAKLLKVLAHDQAHNPFTFVEEKLILYVLIKALVKDPQLVSDAVDLCVDPLKILLLSKKDYLKKLVEHSISLIVRDPKRGKEVFNELNKNGEIISVATVHNCSPRMILQPLWKSFTNPYKADNLLNVLSQKSADSQIKFPAISEYSVSSIPHPQGENLKVEQTLKEYVRRITEEYATSSDCCKIGVRPS